ALGMIMVYIMIRFTGKFALGAVAALIHDVIITIGAFAVFQWTFNLPELAALLAVIGYSLNDTIVVSDRIRENFRSTRRGTPSEIINYSLNQTLGRTLVTSLTTLLVLTALLLAGGEQIAGFARALTIGVVIGTYSSIYVAATTLLILQLSRQDLAVPEKEPADNVP
ncbi:MAG: protein translocase subunit SecF, partial [Pseudomonadales bacterium]|nr:protein translocase subunit SecF [Pseudomonadales bacterium]